MLASMRGAFFGLVVALGAGCGRSELPVPPVERLHCEVSEPWERVLPGRGVVNALAYGGGYLVSGPVGQPQSGDTGVLRMAGDGSSSWDATLKQRWSAILADGRGIVVAGSIGGSPDIEVVGLSEAGAIEWTTKVATEGEDSARFLLRDDDAVVIVGSSSNYGPSATRVLVARVRPSGVEWIRTFRPMFMGGMFQPEQLPFGAFIDAAGRVVVGSKRWLNGGGGPIDVFAVDRQGTVAWQYLDGVAYERGGASLVVPLADGGSLVSGSLPNKGFSGPTRLVRLNGQGQAVWAALLSEGKNEQEMIQDAVELANGDLMLAGYSSASVAGRLWHLSPSGEVIARADYPDAHGAIQFLRAMPGGGFFLASTQTESLGAGAGFHSTWHFVRLDAAGALAWHQQTSGAGVTFLREILRGDDGTIVAGGYFAGNDTFAGRVVRLDEECHPVH